MASRGNKMTCNMCSIWRRPVIRLSIKIRGESVGSRDSSTCAFSLVVWCVGMLTSTRVLPSTPSGLWIGQFVHVDPLAVRRLSVMPGFVCSYCMQRAEIPACNSCRLSKVWENIHEANVLQPITANNGITWRSTCVATGTRELKGRIHNRLARFLPIYN